MRPGAIPSSQPRGVGAIMARLSVVLAFAHCGGTAGLMNRRAFVTGLGAVLAAPLATWAQQAGKVHHIGFLPAGASEAHRRQLEALREGLRELGYVPDKTLVI